MIVKKEHKTSYVFIFLIVFIASYYTLRVYSYTELNGGEFKLDYLNIVLNNLYKITTPLVLTPKSLGVSFFVGFLLLFVNTFAVINPIAYIIMSIIMFYYSVYLIILIFLYFDRKYLNE